MRLWFGVLVLLAGLGATMAADTIPATGGNITLTPMTHAHVQIEFGGKVIHVNSWCRCPTHNKRVGGAEHSLHMRGWAVDITVRGISPYAAWRVLKDFQGEPPKIIGGLGRYPSFVHIDRGRARRWSGP